MQVEQQEEQNKDAGENSLLDGSGPSSSSPPKSPQDKAAQKAPEATPKQGQEAENGAAGEGRVMGTGKRGNLTETEGRSTGMLVKLIIQPTTVQKWDLARELNWGHRRQSNHYVSIKSW